MKDVQLFSSNKQENIEETKKKKINGEFIIIDGKSTTKISAKGSEASLTQYPYDEVADDEIEIAFSKVEEGGDDDNSDGGDNNVGGSGGDHQAGYSPGGDENGLFEPTIWSLLKTKLGCASCCCCRCCCCCFGCGDDGGHQHQRDQRIRKRNIKHMLYYGSAWIIWILPIIIGLFVTIVNIGATYEGNIVRERLPGVNKLLYDTIDEGPVCAYRELDGMSVQPIEFPNKNAAHEAGYLILHCGGCGHCSDWHNLRLEYTTRDFLAKESAKCARKSLLGGADDVQKCLEAPEPINFLGKCAECWTTDILCTKKHCAMIFLQSTLINSVSNFKVNNETITSASCEEANCEVGAFVPCSGATRRRMNVTSSIQRPGAQRCSIVDVTWSELFPE